MPQANETILLNVSIPGFLQEYKIWVLHHINHYENALKPFVSHIDNELKANPYLFETLFTLAGVLIIILVIFKVLRASRLARSGNTGKQLQSLRNELEKTRNQLNNLRKLMQERPVAPIVENKHQQVSKNAQSPSTIQKLIEQLKQQDILIKRYEECIASNNKFNEFFLSQFGILLNQLVDVRKKIKKGTSKASHKSSINQSVYSEFNDLNTTDKNSRQPSNEQTTKMDNNYNKPILNGDYTKPSQLNNSSYNRENHVDIESADPSVKETPKKIEPITKTTAASDQKAFTENSNINESKSAGNKRIPPMVPAKSINPPKVPHIDVQVTDVKEIPKKEQTIVKDESLMGRVDEIPNDSMKAPIKPIFKQPVPPPNQRKKVMAPAPRPKQILITAEVQEVPQGQPHEQSQETPNPSIIQSPLNLRTKPPERPEVIHQEQKPIDSIVAPPAAMLTNLKGPSLPKTTGPFRGPPNRGIKQPTPAKKNIQLLTNLESLQSVAPQSKEYNQEIMLNQPSQLKQHERQSDLQQGFANNIVEQQQDHHNVQTKQPTEHLFHFKEVSTEKLNNNEHKQLLKQPEVVQQPPKPKFIPPPPPSTNRRAPPPPPRK